MQRRKLPDRREAFYLTVVVVCLVAILIVCLTAG
jgi:preprotein translocase subunit SecE